MNDSPSSWKRTAADIFAVLARWLLGAVFLYMGLNKALHPVEFLKMVRQYDLVQSSLLLNSIAAALPWFEVFCGLLLLAGVAVDGGAEGVRTPDLLNAIQALYQLSYDPIRAAI
jgi:uncharacterized membrane protein YphA (DoxX/SURF4 family)